MVDLSDTVNHPVSEDLGVGDGCHDRFIRTVVLNEEVFSLCLLYHG